MSQSIQCEICGSPLTLGGYRLIGIEAGSWRSRYACRGQCEAAAREERQAEASAVAVPVGEALPAQTEADA